jgi:ABC-type uncharacterized transport system permease subunit
VRWSDRASAVTVGVGAVAGALAVASALLLLGGYPPLAAGRALVSGAFGSGETFLSITLVRAVPLILTGLAVALAFRAGVWNIGAEGQLYAGAMAAVWVGLAAGSLPRWALAPGLLLAAALGGAAWALVPALMRLRLGVGEVITTILMNFVGIHLAAYLVHGPLQEVRGVFPQTDPIAAGARLPMLVAGTRLHAGFALAGVAAVSLSLFIRRTRIGFRIRAVGASPETARMAGRIDVGRVTLLAFLASGALAGVAGGVQIAGVTYALYEGLSPGWGYTAIAVALLARLEPVAVLATGVLFGALAAGSGAMQREAGIPSVWVNAVEALIILAVLALAEIQRRGAVAGSAARAGGGEGSGGAVGLQRPDEEHAPGV